MAIPLREQPEEGDNDGDAEWLQDQLAGVQLGGGDDDDTEAEWQDGTGGFLPEVFECCEQGLADDLGEILDNNLSADVNAPGPDGDSPLHLACLYGHKQCVEVLLERGANASIINEEDSSTALHDAAAGGYLEILELLVPKAKALINHADEDGDTPLHNAARGNHKGVVELLLSHGANPNLKNHEGNTPSQEAEEQDVIDVLAAAATASSA